MATTLPTVDDGRTAAPPDGRDQRKGAICAAVLAALGRPELLYRVTVAPLWGGHYRVNVLTGEDPTSVRIPHSYFVTADGRGNIVASTPAIRREYP